MLPDVDIEAVAPEVVQGCFVFSGQVCVATKRVYVHEDIYEPFLKKMVDAASKLAVGNARSASTTMGPMQNRMQYERVMDIIRDSEEKGYKFALGPPIVNDKAGLYITPSIIDNPPPGARVVVEEQFGKSLPLPNSLYFRVNRGETKYSLLTPAELHRPYCPGTQVDEGNGRCCLCQ